MRGGFRSHSKQREDSLKMLVNNKVHIGRAGSNSKFRQGRIEAQASGSAQCFCQALAHLWGTEQVGSLPFRFDFAPKFDWKHRGGFFALFVFTIWTSVVSRGLKDADHALRMRLAAFGQLTLNCRKLECLALFGCRLKLGFKTPYEIVESGSIIT